MYEWWKQYCLAVKLDLKSTNVLVFLCACLCMACLCKMPANNSVKMLESSE